MDRRRNPERAVSASALAQMGVCERLVIFEHLEGKRPTPAKRDALRRGLRAHQRFATEGPSKEERGGRCSIAAHVFGEGPETRILCLFRDRFLRPSSAGRRQLLIFSRLAPSLCGSMERSPMVRAAARAILRPLVWLAKRCLGASVATLVC